RRLRGPVRSELGTRLQAPPRSDRHGSGGGAAADRRRVQAPRRDCRHSQRDGGVLAQDDGGGLSLRHAGQRLPPSRHESGRRGVGGSQGGAGWGGAGVLSVEALVARARAHLDGFERRALPPDGRRPAAVAVVLLGDDTGRACFLLTRRAAGLRQHARQWALPGGRLDPGESAVDAARRELSEEVGLALGPEAALGLLDDYPTRSGFLITPVVFWGGLDPVLAPNPNEVASVHRVPLDDLDHPDVPRLVTIPESDRPVIQVPLLSTLVHAPTAA